MEIQSGSRGATGFSTKMKLLRQAFENDNISKPSKTLKPEKREGTIDDVVNGCITYMDYLKINGHYKTVDYKKTRREGPFPIGIDDVATGKITFAEFKRINEEGADLSEPGPSQAKNLKQYPYN